MRRFFLCEFETVGQGNQRDVAEGVEFSDGSIVMRWFGETPSTVVHKSMPDLTSIHIVKAYGLGREDFATVLGAFPKLTDAERAAHLKSELWS